MQDSPDQVPSRALWSGLIDDAAVFPPGSSPLPEAIEEHRGHRRSGYATLVGPLLVPAGSWAALAALAERSPADPLRVALICRPGTDPSMLPEAMAGLAEHRHVDVVGVELGWQRGWLQWVPADLPVAIEVPRGAKQEVAIDDIRACVQGLGTPAVTKFRTGATPTWPWPDEGELAEFLITTLDLGVPFKLTGGLHHAVRGRYAVAGVLEENHGLVNVVLATHLASTDESSTTRHEDVAALLAQSDPAPLAAAIRDLSEDRIHSLRKRFTAYGCCTVTDPIDELVDLRLLEITRHLED